VKRHQIRQATSKVLNSSTTPVSFSGKRGIVVFFLTSSILLLSACNSSKSDSTGSNAQDPVGGGTTAGAIESGTNSTTSQVPDSTSPNNNVPLDYEPIVLAPLPQTSLSTAPSATDEPIPISGPVSTVTEYFLVRDPGGKLPEDTTGELTDTDYDLGPLPPVIVNPTNVDPTTNSAPYFEGLENQTVFAGEVLDILLKPVDADGSLPGMFPERLPEGAEYIDNLNGTKTVRWRPLQPDVGIRDFTVTAVDADEPQYRSQHTIRIRVQLPADQSGIENFPPAVNAIREHTVQVNDPVVLEIRGTDPNGTVPTLEVLNPPPGATFIEHHSEPEIRVLRFIPNTAGLVSIDVIARDAVDPNSTGTATLEIDVRPASDFMREGPSLLSLATARDFRLGYASLKDFYYRPDGALYARTATQEFNSVTPENSFKWSVVNPLPGRFRWASADNLVSFARTNGMQVHGHTLVWHRQIPNWIKFSKVEERETHMREFIDRMLNRYADRVPIWDVVNEVFEDNGDYRNSVWYEAMQEQYIEIAFRQARESAPNIRLLYNDYDVAWNGPKSSAMFTMLQSLIDREVPLDGVGFQMHLYADFNLFDEVEANFQKAANMNLDVYITELDVSMNDGETEEQQAEVYRRVLDICLKQPRCKGMQTWGFTDQYSWRRKYSPLYLDRAYQVKPAYTALQQRLSEN